MPEKNAVPPATADSHFSEQEIEQGLITLVEESGNSRRAAKRLARLGIKVSHTTLYRWREKHSEKYESMRRDLLPKIRMEAAERHSAMAKAEMEVGLGILSLLHEQKGELEPRDLSTALRNLDVGQGIHETKALELTGDLPKGPTINISFTDQARSLAARGTKFFDTEGKPMTLEEVIEGQAVELPSGDTEGPEAPDDPATPKVA